MKPEAHSGMRWEPTETSEEVTRRRATVIAFDPAEEDAAADAEIDAAFRLRLMGIRGLPRHQRAQARRAARDWHRVALKALREKRAAERRARYATLRAQRPAPRAPGLM